jgi:hypothetical protein
MSKSQSTGGAFEREDDPSIGPISKAAKSQRPPDESGWEPWEIALPESRSRYAPEYAGDPETAVIAFDELWKTAGDASADQHSAFIKTLQWLLLELKAASKSGRRFLRVLPDYYREAIDDGAKLVDPYKKFHDLFVFRLYEWLPRSVNMACRGYGKFGSTADAIIDLAADVCDLAKQFSVSPSGIEQTLGRLDSTALTLEELLYDSTPIPTRTGNGPGADSDSARPESQRQIIETLRRVGHRLTTTKLLAEMERAGLDPALSTVKKYLAEMVKGRRLDNDPKAKPPGYGLSEWSPGSSGS